MIKTIKEESTTWNSRPKKVIVLND